MEINGLPEAIDPLLEPLIDATACALKLCRWAPIWRLGHCIERHRLPCTIVLRAGLVLLGRTSE